MTRIGYNLSILIDSQSPERHIEIMKHRILANDRDATYHCMTRTVNGERLFTGRDKEILRKMIWQVADFCGVDVLTYCVMSNHFHVLVRVPIDQTISDRELLRRYRVLYPRATKYRPETANRVAKMLAEGGKEAEALRGRLLARMGDVSSFMKTLKQRFSIWFNHTHGRFGTLWAERFKSVLVEGAGNPLQTMAAYIDLNPARSGLVDDPKDYRFCGYAEAVAGNPKALEGLAAVWSDWIGTNRSVDRGTPAFGEAVLQSHRSLLFAKGANDGSVPDDDADRVLQKEGAVLSKPAALRCRVRYFTDGAILGSAEFVRSFTAQWQAERNRKHPPKAQPMEGADWGDLTVIRGIRRNVFG